MWTGMGDQKWLDFKEISDHIIWNWLFEFIQASTGRREMAAQETLIIYNYMLKNESVEINNKFLKMLLLREAEIKL